MYDIKVYYVTNEYVFMKLVHLHYTRLKLCIEDNLKCLDIRW